MVQRKCNGIFKITQMRRVTPVMFFDRQWVTYTHVYTYKQTSSVLRATFDYMKGYILADVRAHVIVSSLLFLTNKSSHTIDWILLLYIPLCLVMAICRKTLDVNKDWYKSAPVFLIHSYYIVWYWIYRMLSSFSE
jgi:hypothetical protein